MMLRDDQAEKRADGRLAVADADRILAAYVLGWYASRSAASGRGNLGSQLTCRVWCSQ